MVDKREEEIALLVPLLDPAAKHIKEVAGRGLHKRVNQQGPKRRKGARLARRRDTEIRTGVVINVNRRDTICKSG
jgi:hypothetical protein